MLVVNEIFHSIQGESTLSGCPCVFVRLTGCDLRCSWCDTPYAFHEGTRLSLEAVLEKVLSYGCNLVEITGGEPLLQRDSILLMSRLLEAGKTVMLETGGHRDISDVPTSVVRIVDVKCPRSGESSKTLRRNLELLSTRDQVKFVIADQSDYEYAKGVALEWNLSERCACVLMSPVHGELAPVTLAEWILRDGLAARLQLQIHKYIWSPTTRGV